MQNKTAKKLKVNIIGAGAMGHLWTGYLARFGFQTTLYSRLPKAEQTINISSKKEDFKHCFKYSQLNQWTDADLTLVCLKAHQFEYLCQQLSEYKIKSNYMILMMNGLGLIELAADYLPTQTIYHASTVHGVYLKNNTLVHTGIMGKTLIGTTQSSTSKHTFNTQENPRLAQQNIKQLIKQMDMALPNVEWNNHQTQALNLKLIINAIINPLTALANKPNGFVLRDNNKTLIPEALELLAELKPLLLQLLPDKSFEQVKLVIEQIAFDTRNNISSMLQDIQSGQKTEIEFINGYLVSLAKKQSIQLPKHQQIIKKIKQLTNSQNSSETR